MIRLARRRMLVTAKTKPKRVRIPIRGVTKAPKGKAPVSHR